MRRADVLAGAPFRTALLALAVFVPTLALIGASLHRSLGAAMLDELEAQVLAELVLLRDIVDEGGTPALVDAVRRMERTGADEPRLTGLFDAHGARLAGDVGTAPTYLGWRTIELARFPEHESGAYRARAERWRRTTVVVGRSTSLVERALDALVADLLIAGAVVTALCLCLGYAVSRSTRDKLALLTDTLDRVSSGEVRARVPVGPGDEQVDRVSRRINAHLERLSTLMASLGNTAGAIAHDLRSPLSRASLGLQEVLADESLDPRHAALLEGTARELDGLCEIVETVLRIARIEAADGRDLGPVPLAGLVREIDDAFGAVAEERGQTLRTDAPAPGPTVRGDARMLRRLLANLVENAIRHCPPGTSVRVAVREGEGGPELVVEDDGPGVPAAERERVLEPFVRLDPSRTAGGTGLGLALVAAVARRHGARLVLEDARPGLRATVAFPPEPVTQDKFARRRCQGTSR